MTDNGVWSYSYNGRSQLISATDGTDTVNYKYDALGRKVVKEVVGFSEERYFYFKHQRIADYDNNTDTLEKRYVHGTNLDEVLFCIDSAGVVQFLSYDLNRSAIGITDAIGGLISTFSYSPFGESSGILDGMPSYQGQRYDATLDLYDFKYRIYSQQHGRFMQPDPVAQPGDNKYLFVGNSPLNFKDPLGLTFVSNLMFLEDFISGNGPDYRNYDESSVETQELKNSALGAFLQMAAFGVGKDNTSDNPLEVGFDSMDAAKLTMLPGVKMLATGNTEKAISADPGMLGNTAFQLGGVKRDPRNVKEKTEQEWIQLYRNDDKYVTVTLRNVANSSSFLYHLDQYINDDVLSVIALSLPGLADTLKHIKSMVKDGNQKTFRTIYQTFSWTIYAPLPKGYCGKG